MRLSRIKAIFVYFTTAFLLFSLMLCAVGCENKEQKAFNESLTQLQDVYDNLNQKISEADSLLKNTSTTDVDDSKTISNLSSENDKAKKLIQSIEIPSSDSESKDYATLTESNNESTKKINEEIKNLNLCLDNVKKSKEEKKYVAAKLIDRFNHTEKDPQGYDIQTCVSSTSWIRANNNDLISKAWNNAGGNGQAPKISSFNNSNTGYNDYNESNCCVLIGNVKFTNKTINYHINSNNKKNPGLTVEFFDSDSSHNIYNSVGGNITEFMWATSNNGSLEYGSLCWDNGKTRKSSLSKSGNLVSADMSDDSYGPVPFMIVAHDIFNPKFPNGCPTLDNIMVAFNTQGSYAQSYSNYKEQAFLPGKTW